VSATEAPHPELHHRRQAKRYKVTATFSDGHSFTASEPLLDGALYWQALGAPSSATSVTVWSSGPGHWALRSTIGHTASLTVMGDRFKKLK
jgi:hypothetical protein